MDLRAVDLITEAIRTERLLLRPPRPDDAETVYLACQDPDILRWTVNLPDPYTRADATAWVSGIAPADRADRRGLPCVVEADGQLVGSAGLSFEEHGPTVEVGYWIAAPARRKGYAAEATAALAEWAFGHGAEGVRLLTLVGNTASQAVAQRAGFHHQHRVRGALRLRDGSRADAELFLRRAED